jgi:hypothetical protein
MNQSFGNTQFPDTLATETNGDIVSYPAKTVFAFACYLLPLGLCLLLVPNLLLSLFQIPPTSEVWIRVVGMLVIFLGVYYFVAAHAELRLFMIWSARLRASVFIFFGAFVLAGLAPSVLLLFGAVDLAAALWTWSAFRNENSIR